MSDVVVFGIGDFARMARIYLDQDSPHEVQAFTVHERYITGEKLEGLPVVPFEQLEQSHPPGSHEMFVAIGFSRVNESRAGVYRECKNRGYGLITYVSSKALPASDLEIGDNCFVFE